MDLDGIFLPDHAAQHFFHSQNELGEIENPRLENLLAAEGEQLTRKCGGALAGLHDLIEQAVAVRLVGVRRLQEADIALDDGKQIIEFVRDAKTRAPFPPDARVAFRVQADALEAGVMTYPMQGSVDGTRGDHILIAPPYIITTPQIQMLVRGLEQAIGDLETAQLLQLILTSTERDMWFLEAYLEGIAVGLHGGKLPQWTPAIESLPNIGQNESTESTGAA